MISTSKRHTCENSSETFLVDFQPLYQSGFQIFIMFENSAKSKIGVASLTYNVIGSIDPDHSQLDLVWSFIISTLKNLVFARTLCITVQIEMQEQP